MKILKYVINLNLLIEFQKKLKTESEVETDKKLKSSEVIETLDEIVDSEEEDFEEFYESE